MIPGMLCCAMLPLFLEFVEQEGRSWVFKMACSCNAVTLVVLSIPLSIHLRIYREMTILTYFKLSKGIFLNFNDRKAL